MMTLMIASRTNGIMTWFDARILEIITNPRIYLTIRSKKCSILKIGNVPQWIACGIAMTARTN
jgi:hypothetical protein